MMGDWDFDIHSQYYPYIAIHQLYNATVMLKIGPPGSNRGIGSSLTCTPVCKIIANGPDPAKGQSMGIMCLNLLQQRGFLKLGGTVQKFTYFHTTRAAKSSSRRPLSSNGAQY